MRKRKAFTLIELLVVVAIIALLISILLPSLSRAREITKRAVCASQLRGIGQATKVYANDNADFYPTVLFRPTTQSGGYSSVTWITKMSDRLTSQVTSTDDSWYNLHPSRCMFMMVIDGSCSAKQYVCPSSGDTEDDLKNYVSGNLVAASPGNNRFDFRGYPYVSYGIQFPFGNRGQGNENLDTRMVIMADKGPFFQSGSSFDNGYRTADTAVTAFPVGQQLQGFPGSVNDPQPVLNMDTDKWRPYNSRNHGSEGQNCLYQDGHATFEKKPIVGVNFDNIYTQHALLDTTSTLWQTLVGMVPNNNRGPSTNTDSVIVP